MKLKEKTRQRYEMSPPRVKLTDAEILADLNYPAPPSDRGDLIRERKRSASR